MAEVNITESTRTVIGVQTKEASPGYYVCVSEAANLRNRLVLVAGGRLTFLDDCDSITVSGNMDLILNPVESIDITFKL